MPLKGMNKVKDSVLIAVPMYDCPTIAYYHSILNIAFGRTKTPLKIGYTDECGVAMVHKARNNLAARFLQTNNEWLLMTDADMSFTVKDIELMVSRGQELIGGIYRQRAIQNPPVYVLNTLDNKPFNPLAAPVQQVKYVGTGFLLIHHTVLERMIAAYPEIEYTSDGNEGLQKRWDFFSTGIHRDESSPIKNRYLSGDWYFCQRWNDMGEKVFVDCEVKLGHSGNMMF